MRSSAEEGHKRRGIPLPFAIAAHEDQPPKCAPLPLGVVVSCDSTRIRPNEARARTSIKASGIFLISSCAATISSAGVAGMVQRRVQKVVSDKLVVKTIFVKVNDLGFGAIGLYAGVRGLLCSVGEVEGRSPVVP